MNSRMERMVYELYRLVVRWPVLILVTSLALAAGSLLYARDHLTFWTERNVLLSQESLSARRYLEYRKEFPDDYLIVVLTSRNLDRAKEFASLLGERLEADPVPVQEVFYRIPIENFRRQALLYLDPEEIDELRERISKHQALLERLAASPDLVTLLETINGQISRALVRTAVSGLFGEEEEEEPEKSRVDPEDLKLLSSIMESLSGWLGGGAGYRSPWKVLLSGKGGLSEDGFLVDEDRGWVFVLVYLRDIETSFNREGAAIDRIREHIRAVSERVDEVDVGVTGTPALNSEEMAVSLRDMTRASLLALGLVTALFVLGFGRARRPLIAVLALAMGILWTVGWLSLTIGHLTILSMAFGSILIGLGIDFGIHVVARYEKEVRGGLGSEAALEATFRAVGRPVLSTALTTAAAFLAMALSEFRGLKEFGWIAGWGILFCFASQILVLPSALLLLERRRSKRRPGQQDVGGRPALFERALAWPSGRPRWILSLGVILGAVAFLPLGHFRFDYNLLHLQAKGTEAVDWELRLLEAEGNSSIFAADMVDSLEQAHQRARQYEGLPLVREVESLATYLPADPEERVERVRQLGSLLEGVTLSGASPAAPDARRVERWVSKIRFKLREEEEKEARQPPAGAEAIPAPDTVSGARYRTEQVLRILEASKGSGELSTSLAGYQERLAQDFRRKLDILRACALDPLPVTLDSLPRLLKKRFVGKTGKWLLQVYPKEDIWQAEPQRRFVEQIRKVRADLTGPAVVNYESTRSLLDAYVKGGIYAVAAILVILLIDFRHPLLAALSLVPLVMGWLWTLAGMRLSPLTFNPANLVIIPLLVGIGVDNGIHVVRHFLAGASPDEEIAGSSLGRAITLSSLTTIAGFGSLMVAHHHGIWSIGMLLCLAMSSCLAASLVFLPSLLRLLPAGWKLRIWRMGQTRSRPPESGFTG